MAHFLLKAFSPVPTPQTILKILLPKNKLQVVSLYVCSFVCQTVCLYVGCIYTPLPAHIFTHINLCLCVCLFVCLFILKLLVCMLVAFKPVNIPFYHPFFLLTFLPTLIFGPRKGFAAPGLPLVNTRIKACIWKHKYLEIQHFQEIQQFKIFVWDQIVFDSMAVFYLCKGKLKHIKKCG